MKRPTWERYTVVAQVIPKVSVRDRRMIFQLLRRGQLDPNILFPQIGITLGEFATWHILSDHKKKIGCKRK